MSTRADLAAFDDAALERERQRLLIERDAAHNHLRHLTRQLDDVRAELLARVRASRAPLDPEC